MKEFRRNWNALNDHKESKIPHEPQRKLKGTWKKQKESNKLKNFRTTWIITLKVTQRKVKESEITPKKLYQLK